MSEVDIAYAVSGQGPALYLVHGIGARKTAWAGMLSSLEPYFTCVTADLRGHGGSSIPPLPYSLNDLVQDVERLRQTLGHQQIHIAGHSLGGMIGPAYARVHSERCLSVALFSTAAGRSEEDRLKLQAVIDAMRSQGVAPVLETLVNRWFTDSFVKTNPAAIEKRLTQVTNTPEDVFLEVFRIYAETEMGPWLHEIQCPCLVLTGELDGGCNPQLNRFIHDQLPHSELVILDGLKHSILVEAPGRVVAHLLKFLRAQTESAT